jgi:site-specific DNA-methyltransferase (adenine-specific)
MAEKTRAPRNRTVTLDDADRVKLRSRLTPPSRVGPGTIDATVLGDCQEVAGSLAPRSVDLLFLDPPYNLNKRFGDNTFTKKPVEQYTEWLGGVLDNLLPTVKRNGTVYICGDWHTSASIFAAAADRLNVRNRITWEREKGRGAKTNWKNSSEDIWFCTIGDEYTFNVDDVKVRRKVIAPYRNDDGSPKDWSEGADGNHRDTHPSNLWTDISIPFWSMPENTDHPTQKSEKLLAKLILASTNSGDFVLDPFLGSGTTSVVAKKLGRHYLGIECEEEYALLAEKRLELANTNAGIQGYSDGVFWERNSLNAMNGKAKQSKQVDAEPQLLI